MSIITGRNNIKIYCSSNFKQRQILGIVKQRIHSQTMIHHLHTLLHLLKNFQQRKYRGREGKELTERRIGLGKRLKHFLRFWKLTKCCIMFHCQTYLNKDKKLAAVKQIAEQLETNEENISKKLASLRSYYCQLRSQYKSAKTKSSSGTAGVKKPTWPFFDSLKFLDDNLTVKGTSSSINLSEVSQFKKKRKEVNSSEVDEWMTNQNALMSKLIQS